MNDPRDSTHCEAMPTRTARGVHPVGAAVTEGRQVGPDTARYLPGLRALAVTQRSANGPQEVRPTPTIADDVQRSHESVSAGQNTFAGID